MEEKLNQETLNELFDNKDITDMWKKMHTPCKAIKMPGRNDICPFCNSGKKFKNCKCYEKYGKQTEY